MKLAYQYMTIFFVQYKSRIATAIRGLYWMKMTMVNSGLKRLIKISGLYLFENSVYLFCQFI